MSALPSLDIRGIDQERDGIFFHLKKEQGNLGLLKQEGLKLDSYAEFLTLRKVQEYPMSLKSLLSKRLEISWLAEAQRRVH